MMAEDVGEKSISLRNFEGRCPSPSGRSWDPTKSLRPSVQAVWAKCGRRETRGWTA
jgi:hypothetical protein